MRQCGCVEPCLRLSAKKSIAESNPSGIQLDADSNTLFMHAYVPSGTTKLRSVRGASRHGLRCEVLCDVTLMAEVTAADGSYSGRVLEPAASCAAPFALHGKMSRGRHADAQDQ
jgi:hypothetical protein